MPARVLFDALKPKLLPASSAGLKISEPKGSIWKGAIDLEVSGMSFRADWDILQSQLFKGELAVAISVTSQSPPGNLKTPNWIKGTIFGSIFGKFGCYNVNAMVSAELINHLANGQFSLENKVVMNALEVNFKDNSFKTARGKLNWPGGLIAYYDPSRGQQQVDLPALTGEISTEQGKLTGRLGLDDSSGILVSAEVDGKGEAIVAIRKRMLDVLGQGWSKAVDPDDVILEIQQALF